MTFLIMIKKHKKKLCTAHFTAGGFKLFIIRDAEIRIKPFIGFLVITAFNGGGGCAHKSLPFQNNAKSNEIQNNRDNA